MTGMLFAPHCPYLPLALQIKPLLPVMITDRREKPVRDYHEEVKSFLCVTEVLIQND